MATGIHRDKRREMRWRRLVDSQQRSGLTIRAFCREQDLRETAFYFWRGELARRQGEQEQRQESAQPRRAARRGARPERRPRSASFVPVELTSSNVEPMSGRSEPPADGRIEIVLSGGRRVHVPAPVNRAALADVLAVLEARTC